MHTHQTWREDRAAGREAFGAIAERLVCELRARVVDRSPPTTLTGIAARLDARLPTDTLEHIDDPAFPEARRTAAIRRLDGLNRLLGSYVRFADALEPLLPADLPATVLDIASGHGGFAIALARLARDRGRPLRVIASDLRAEYLDLGRRRAAAEGVDVEFRVVDAFAIDASFAPGEIDVVTCTQTLHHFGPAMAAGLIAESVRVARRGILFVDALRSLQSLLLLGALTFLGSLDAAFCHDAVVSIRKSFVPEELSLVARCAPGGEALDAFFLPPGFAALRTPVPSTS
jgi:2-polyprenyl-3-methyl-5-hydroxy-6-metoxy-1,4-benzoquinol methylase